MKKTEEELYWESQKSVTSIANTIKYNGGKVSTVEKRIKRRREYIESIKGSGGSDEEVEKSEKRLQGMIDRLAEYKGEQEMLGNELRERIIKYPKEYKEWYKEEEEKKDRERKWEALEMMAKFIEKNMGDRV